ncbi:hypothetical protein AN639_05085 [Candidatus Epulonipiscium fishelsonii]|uniref:Uncharacterized protein n=1 Tax=Candidatus Epulonipiscium fishelsonii TaxID=77094 RepID=A0ACC8XBL9_9FIRM|nr:hypothetical protein AN396_06870 [Epulopiscium sp. SCG-B11WGA-EpuloA1]ONI40260.1 hypothetical protein AN639_05085 [Epulopiscium sp. SCG-B05WGA-EpuloA1]
MKLINISKNALIALLFTYMVGLILGARTNIEMFLDIGFLVGATTCILVKIDELSKALERTHNNKKED